ncbi:MAG: HEPN domain-containing protein [Candidatus Xenobia bacterium]
MTEDNRRANISEEWALSDQAWVAAEGLVSLRLWRPAVSQYYYAVYHAAMSALLSRELEPKTHAGVHAEFNRAFIHSTLLPAELSSALRHRGQEREAADYKRAAVFTPQNAEEARTDAAMFRTAVQALLSSEGWMV